MYESPLASTNSRTRRIDLLLVEDYPADVRAVREAFEQTGRMRSLTVAADGETALKLLRREVGYEHAPRPDLILLDLNLPGLDGFGVLGEIRADRRLSTIPVLVLTTSDSEIDVVRSYELFANCFVTKPTDFDGFVQLANEIMAFWVSRVTLPPKSLSAVGGNGRKPQLRV